MNVQQVYEVGLVLLGIGMVFEGAMIRSGAWRITPLSLAFCVYEFAWLIFSVQRLFAHESGPLELLALPLLHLGYSLVFTWASHDRFGDAIDETNWQDLRIPPEWGLATIVVGAILATGGLYGRLF